MKRIISLMLAIMLILSVAAMVGCNNGKKADTGSASKPSSASSAQSAASVPEGAAPIATTPDGNATGYTKIEKDEKGNVTRNYTYDSLGKLQGSVGYEYDDKGYVAKEIHYNADGIVSAQIAFERNEKGLETQRIISLIWIIKKRSRSLRSCFLLCPYFDVL